MTAINVCCTKARHGEMYCSEHNPPKKALRAEIQALKKLVIQTAKINDELVSRLDICAGALNQASKRCENFLAGLKPPHDNPVDLNTFVMIDAIKRDCDEAIAALEEASNGTS